MASLLKRSATVMSAALAMLVGLLPIAEVAAQFRNQGFNERSISRPPLRGDGPARPQRPFGGGGFGVIIDPGVFEQPPRGLPPPPPGGRRVIVEDDEDDAPPRRVRQTRPAQGGERRRPPPQPPRVVQPAPPPAPRLPVNARVVVPVASEQRLVEREVLVHLRDGLSEQQTEALFRRQRLERLDSQRIALIGLTLHRLRIPDNRTPRTVLVGLRSEARIATAQPNYVYRLEQQQPTANSQSETDSAATAPATAALAAPVAVQRLPQYAIDKLDLVDVHRQSRGARIKIAVIDSGIDTGHPELLGALDKAGDMLTGAAALPGDADTHGTGMASAVFARSQLTGVAPAASLLAVRAFKGTVGNDRSGAQGTSWHVLKGIDWSVAEGARVLNLSFAGPRDELVSRALAAASARGVVAIAAAGNAGPASPPLFPASDANVIAVTALDAEDKVFAMANRGRHIAVAAPGVDVLVAQPSSGYGMTTGTSVATAHVSGLVALLIERDARLGLTEVRNLLTSTARDLGAPGRDAETGAGMINIRAALARMPPPR
jgi:hypothetical protein